MNDCRLNTFNLNTFIIEKIMLQNTNITLRYHSLPYTLLTFKAYRYYLLQVVISSAYFI